MVLASALLHLASGGFSEPEPPRWASLITSTKIYFHLHLMSEECSLWPRKGRNGHLRTPCCFWGGHFSLMILQIMTGFISLLIYVQL